MKTAFNGFAILISTLGLASPADAELRICAQPGVEMIRLKGPDSSQQLVVRGKEDLTRKAAFSAKPDGVVSVDPTGLVTPLANGRATVTASFEGETASLALVVSEFEKEQPLSFPNDILPVITRNHCNAGACHAKTDSLNGFTLSLFGYDPEADHRVLVKQARGRRISITSPDLSLVLQKASGTIPHGGGSRLDPTHPDYRTLRRWISQGAVFTPPGDPAVDRIEIFPKEIVVSPGGQQQVSVSAYFDDGTVRDITRITQFEPNQPEMASVDESGLIHFRDTPGATSIMVRFKEFVDVLQATIPLSSESPDQPEPNNFIDEEIFQQLSLLGIPASDLTDDREFLRRVTLDIAGRLPTLEETRSFLESDAPDKRRHQIRLLLTSTDYADYFAGKWAAILRNKANPGQDWVFRETFAFHSWIRRNLIENKPFDRFAAELITASGKATDNPAVGWYREVTDPKERMQDIAQVFLGIRMQCAQCHHHPYERWSQDDYYGFAAFFSTIQRKEVYKLPEDDIIYHNRKPARFENPASKTQMKPCVPGGEPLDLAAEQDPRFELAKWVGSPENPYFAKVVVNRHWKHFFGRGLVEPEDDIRPTNPATHPALLEKLADDFVKSGFDLRRLIETICSSRTYQLSSEPKGKNAADFQNYARYYPKRMQAEVLLDAFNAVTGSRNSFNRQPLGVRAVALPDDSANKESQFLTAFGRPQMDTACECERTPEANLGQSLHLINSDVIQQKLGDGRGRALAYARDERSAEELIGELYLVALCREPDEREMNSALGHIRKKLELSEADPKKLSPEQAKREAFEDLIWVLANTKEFMFNH